MYDSYTWVAMIRGQAEPIAVVILTVAGLVIALLTWSWVNAQVAPVSMQALLTQYLAFERSREFATLLASGVNPNSGYYEYIVELYHTIETNRRWFAFALIVYGPNGDIDVNATASLSQALLQGTSAQVYLLMPSSEGGFVRNSTMVEKLVVKPDYVVLADGVSLALHTLGALKNITLMKVPEYLTGVGDPTPNADVDILIDPALIPPGDHIYLVTFTMFNDKWYEVTRIMLR